MITQKVNIWCNKTEWLKSEGKCVEEANLVKEEFPSKKTSWSWYPIALSAKNEDALYVKICDLREWVQKEAGNASLGNISYTLLACRSHFNIRCAMVVCSMEELTEYLNILYDSKRHDHVNSMKRIYKSGRVMGEDFNQLTQTMNLVKGSLFEEEDEFSAMKRLMMFYVKGADISKEIFASTSYRKISMPTYPFLKEIYLVSNELVSETSMKSLSETSEELSCNAVGPKKYPMFDSIRYEKDEIICNKILSKQDFFLREHQVGTEMVLPGVAYLEMARSALENAITGVTVTRIKEVLWLNAVRLQQATEQTEVFIRLKEQANEEYEFRITAVRNGIEQVHGYGVLECGDKHAVAENVSINDLCKDFQEELTAKECYEQLENHGLMLGEAFHTIKKVQKNDHMAIGTLSLPDGLMKEHGSFVLHPSLLDGALEIVSCLFYDNYGEKGSASLPFCVKQVDIYHAIPEECYAYVTESKDQIDQSVSYDVSILSVDGKICVTVQGFALVYKKSEKPLFYQPIWMDLGKPDKTGCSKKILVLSKEKSLVQSLRENGNEVVLLQRADRFQKNEAGYELDVTKKEQVIALLDELGWGGKFGILYVTTTEENNTENWEQCFFTILSIAAAVYTKGIKDVSFLHATDQVASPINDAIAALLKTIRLEYGSFAGKSLVTNNIVVTIASLYDSILEGAGTSYQYVDGKLKVLTYDEAEMEPSLYQPEKDEVYLITGGAGGLGSMVAKLLISFGVSVILVGRSKETSHIQNVICSLRQGDGQVEYVACDISKRDEVGKLIADIKEKYGAIHGIIHAAGVNRDSMLWNKKEDEAREVFAAKILGTVLLDEMTKQENLKQFICFSSIASIGGCIGQTDYSYANGFMDGYMKYRKALQKSGKRNGKSYSINWSLWDGGGMQVQNETKEYFKEVMGITPLSEADGMNALLTIMNGEEVQVACMSGERERIVSNICLDAESKTTLRSEQSEDRMNEYVTEMIAQSMMEILKLKRSNIKSDTELADYGFNSLTFTSLANDLNKRFHTRMFTPASFFELDSVAAIRESVISKHYDQIKKECGQQNESVSQSMPQKKVTQPKVMSQDKRTVEKKTSEKKWEQKLSEREPIAIIGIDGVMPQSENLEEFWNHLKNEDDLITEIPKERWDWKKYYSEDGVKPNTTYSKWGGFMKEVDQFDYKFFGISPKEAELMDPQQRIFLETIYHTIDNAGYRPSDFAGTKTGLFVGVSTMDYYNLMKEAGVPLEAHTSTGISHCVLANRISYLLDIHGPSEPIDTACSSSLIAIHRAVESIHNGDCDMAFAGGVNVILSPMLHISFGKAGMLSRDGRCKSFDASANGYVRGEGSGAVILKPLSKAKQDHDHIYAVIRSTAVNHGGKANTLTSPNVNAQADLLYRAYSKAEINLDEISYLEAHGTGTSLGDPVEINGIKKAYRMLKDANVGSNHIIHPCCEVGTVKTNIGHLEAAAGIAGILKVILAMEHKILPGNVHQNQLNPYIQLDQTPFHILSHTTRWNALKNAEGKELPRIAGVSSFGFGGANAHIVLEEYQEDEAETTSFDQNLFVVSAKKQSSLQLQAKALAEYLKGRAQEISEEQNDEEDTKRILSCIAKHLFISERDIDQLDRLSEYGMDVIQLEKIIEEINQEFSIEIAYGEVSEYQSIKELVHMVREQKNSDTTTHNPEKNSFKEQAWLNQIAYTLQVGRKAEQERLCIVAASVSELRAKLDAFIAGSEQMGVYSGSIKGMEDKQGDIFNGEEGNQFIGRLFEAKNYNKLAKLFVMGFDIPWEVFYQNRHSQRIALPGYQFNHKRVWFRDEKKETVAVENKPVYAEEKEMSAAHAAEQKIKPVANVVEKKPSNIDWEQIMTEADDSIVTLEVIEQNIALIRMQDRKNRNMFSNQLIGGLMKRFREIKGRDDIKAIIVTGYDNVFSMGGTQEQLQGIANATNQFTDIPFLYRGLLNADVPVISVIQGHASGGGMLFGLYGDIVMLSEESVYSAVFMKYGFTPGMGATYILPEKLGSNIANEMMYTARAFTGAELREKGVAVMVLKREDMLAKAISIGRLIAEKPVNSLRVLKKELCGRNLARLNEVLESETNMHQQTFSDPDVVKKINRYYSSTLGNSENKEPTTSSSPISALKIKNVPKRNLPKRVDIKGIEETNKKENSDSKAIQRKCLFKVLTDMKSRIITPEEARQIVHKIMGVVREDQCENMNERMYYERILNEDINAAEAIAIMLELSQESEVEKANPEMIKKPITKPSITSMEKAEESKGTSITKDEIKHKLLEIFQNILHIDDDYEDGTIFSDMGIDSINGVEIVRDINNKFGLNIDTVALYDHSNLDALVAYLCEKMKQENPTFF